MKKLLLLVIAFLPVLGFGQVVDLVRWNKANFTPSYVNSASDITASNITITGGGLSHQAWGDPENFFSTDGWPNGAIATGNYVEFTIAPKTGKQITLSNFKFTFRAQANSQKFEIRCSKNNFSSYQTIANVNVTSSWVDGVYAFPTASNFNLVADGQTMKIRVYVDGNYSYNNFLIKRVFNAAQSSNFTQTPIITGTISSSTPPVPVAIDDTASIAHNTATAISVLGNDTYNGLATTVALVSGQGPANGTVSVNGSNQVVYTPTNGFTGTNTFKYKITNANGTSNEATVTVNVAPRANDDTASTSQNTAATITVLSNDVYNATPTVAITQAPANGTATVNASGQIVYTPTVAFIGSNTIKYTITNTHGTSAEATVTVSVIPPVPVANADTASTLQNNAVTVNVLSNDTYNGLVTTVAIFEQSTNGTATVNGSNQVVFTPTTGYTGTTTFKYRLTNANGTSTPATVTVSVTLPVAPTAVADSFPVSMNTYTDLSVLANDNLGSATSITSITPTTPAHGTVAVNANNTIRYTPTTGYAGTDSFSYSFATIYGTTSVVNVDRKSVV